MAIPTKKTALTNAKLTALTEALNTISQGRQITVDGKNVPRGYVLDSETRYSLARIAILIRPLVDAFNAANDALFRSANPISQDDKNGQAQLVIPVDGQLKFNAQVADLFKQKSEKIELPLICYESLKVGDDKGQNPLSPNAIAALDPVLVWSKAEYDALKRDGKPLEDADASEPEQPAANPDGASEDQPQA